MKIFISYGHEDHTQLVDRLFDVLMAAGHEPWKDDRYEGNSGIAPGKDFTQVIYKAIDDADFVLAFVSRITKEKPYCCDERQYAYNKKGSRFIQLRLDRTEITLGNSRSYIDLSDVEDTTGSINEKLFENACNALFAAFRDPESFAEGGITPWTKINTHLRVPGALRYDEFVATLDGVDFVGRQWLVERCRAWAQDSTIRKRLFVIQGEAGTGKTAFVRHLAQDQELVRSVHVCVYDKPSTRTLRDTLKDLAYVLACKGGAYYEFLKTENLEKIREMAEDALFEYLFLEPLKTVQEKYLLIIDGLDELEENAGLRPLIRLFRQYAHKINPNISFLVTTRPDTYITEQLRTVGGSQPLESIALDATASREDLICYIRQKLEKMDCYTDELAAKILEVCDGNFEYLSLLFREAMEDGVPVTEDSPMPRGLNERYVQYLDRRMETGGYTKLTREQHKLLSLLSVCCEAIPISLLAEVAELDEYDAEEALELFGSLLRQTESDGELLIALFTKSFRDFLVGKSCRRYSANKELGLKLLCGYMLTHCPLEKDLTATPYLNRNGVIHLLQYAPRETAAVTEYLQRLEASGCNIVRRIAEALMANTEGTAEGYLAICEALGIQRTVPALLRDNRAKAAAEALAAQFRQAGWMLDALRMEADLLLWDPTPKKKAEAGRLYLQLLEEAQKQYGQKPGYETRRALAESYHMAALFHGRKKTPEGKAKAVECFSKMEALAAENYRERPDRFSRRMLMLAYDGSARYGNQTQTEEWLRKILDLARKSHGEKPGYQTRRDLSAACAHLAAVLRQEDRLDEAEALCREALALAEQNFEENPSFETRNSLAGICDRLGNIAKKRATREGREEAAYWYTREKELVEQSYRENPCFVSRQDLAVAYERLGDLERDKRTRAGDAEAEVLYRKRLELVEQSYRENPYYDSRRSLILVCGRLRLLEERKNTPEGLEEARKWSGEEVRLAEQNYEENPCTQSLLDLADAYDRTGTLTDKRRQENWQQETKQWFMKALELQKLNYSESASQTNRRSLALAYNRLGILASRAAAEGWISEAEKWHLEELALLEENLSGSGTFQNHRMVAQAYCRFAEFGQKKRSPEGQREAESWLRKTLAVCEACCGENPGEESRQLLGDACSKLIQLLRGKRTKEAHQEAEALCQKKVSLAEENYRERPNARTRRILALACDLMGGIKNGGLFSPAAEPARWYARAAELLEENYREEPTNATRQDLIIACGRLGDLYKRANGPQHPEEAIEWYLKKKKLAEERYDRNPNEESREGLIACYEQLGGILERKQTPEALSSAEALYRRSLALLEQNEQETSKKQSGRIMEMICHRLAHMIDRKNTPEAQQEAKCFYQKEAEQIEALRRTEKDAVTGYRLAMIYKRIGEIEHGTADRKAAEPQYLKAMKLLEAISDKQLNELSRTAMAELCGLLAQLAAEENTPESREKMIRWQLKQKCLQEKPEDP